MLHVAPKGQTAPAAPLTVAEDALLRAAFGRFGGRAEDRAAAALLVQRHQQEGSGRWFLCDCCRVGGRPPALVPVALTHIRRHQDDRWPVHCAWCDFHREPAEQRVVTASYADRRGAVLRLARPLATGEPVARRVRHGVTYHRRRPGLGRLLAGLVTSAGLQRAGAEGMPPLGEQVSALWRAARAVELEAGVRLADFFCTRVSKLPELLDAVGRVPAGLFRRNRPLGVLIARVASIAEGGLRPLAGPVIPVLGRIAVFGEDVADVAEARAPFVAACLVGRAAVDGPVEVLSAYAHPCASASWLMLVDSDRERQTLAQLCRLQGWLRRKAGLVVAIDKPLFDVGAEAPEGAPPRPPLIPDFLVRDPSCGAGRASVLVETMGYSDPGYRERKARLHPMMASALGEVPVVLHDFHEPAHWPQAWRDNRLWRDVRVALSRERAGAGGSAQAMAATSG